MMNRLLFSFMELLPILKTTWDLSCNIVLAVGCSVTMLCLGTYMYLQEGWTAAGVEPVATFFPVACIFIFTITCTLGFLVVPWVMIGEVYPIQVYFDIYRLKNILIMKLPNSIK